MTHAEYAKLMKRRRLEKWLCKHCWVTRRMAIRLVGWIYG